jgi:hypothetical protein
MKHKHMFIIITITLMLAGFQLTQAESQFRIVSFIEKPLIKKFSWRFQPVAINLAKSQTMIAYLGPVFNHENKEKERKLKLGLMFGNKFVEHGDLKLAGLVNLVSKRWFLSTQLDCDLSDGYFWNIAQIRYTVLKETGLWIGLEMENIYGKEDIRYISTGPNIGIEMSKVISISLTYFTKWSGGEKSDFFRLYAILNLSNL